MWLSWKGFFFCRSWKWISLPLQFSVLTKAHTVPSDSSLSQKETTATQVCACVCVCVPWREKRDIGVGVCDTSSLHIRLLQLMHKWVWVSSTSCVPIGVYVCAWERRCCQPAFVCVSAHVSLFKHHTLVIWRRRAYGAEQNLVTLLVHCHVYKANIRPQPRRPHPITPLFSFCHLPRSAGMEEQL